MRKTAHRPDAANIGPALKGSHNLQPALSKKQENKKVNFSGQPGRGRTPQFEYRLPWNRLSHGGRP